MTAVDLALLYLQRALLDAAEAGDAAKVAALEHLADDQDALAEFARTLGDGPATPDAAGS